MRVVEIPFGAVGVDFLQPVSSDVSRALASFTLPDTRTGITFVERYLENLTSVELAGHLAAGLGVVLVGESRANGWIPSDILGSADGLREVTKARALGVPPGMFVECDLEGMGGTGTESIAYCQSWCHVMHSANYGAMAYVGAGIPLSPQQLYSLAFTRYHRSLSIVQEVANVDYCILQGFPTTIFQLATGPLAVDLDFVQKDKRGRLPTMLVAD